jgi:hypothetical protein
MRPLGSSCCRCRNNKKLGPKNRMQRCGLDVFGPESGPVKGYCEHGDESLSFRKCMTPLTSLASVNCSTVFIKNMVTAKSIFSFSLLW